MILIREYDFRENKKATYTKLITGLLAATPPSIRLNFLTLPVESLYQNYGQGNMLGQLRFQCIYLKVRHQSVHGSSPN